MWEALRLYGAQLLRQFPPPRSIASNPSKPRTIDQEYLLDAEHILLQPREDKSQGVHLIVGDLAVDTSNHYSVLDSLCSARDILGELHQFPIEVCARGIDIIQSICPLDISGCV